MSYGLFKREVLKNAHFACENPHCDGGAETVHHFLKKSTHSEYSEEVENGMACCGRCHTEIERRIREGEDFLELYPIGRYNIMMAKAGITRPEGFDVPERVAKARALRVKADEIAHGQGFLGEELI